MNNNNDNHNLYGTAHIDEILRNEAKQNIKENWRKLDKTTKVTKLAEYSRKVGQEQNMNDEETINLSKYLIESLDRTRLISVKDVIYDNKTGDIENIPCLHITGPNKYTLKRVEKRASTLKALGPRKSKKKEKIEVINNN